jgi:hypothetical protein
VVGHMVTTIPQIRQFGPTITRPQQQSRPTGQEGQEPSLHPAEGQAG